MFRQNCLVLWTFFLLTAIKFNMKKYKIISAYPCLIKSASQQLTLDRNFSLLLENENEISVYPFGKDKSFAFIIQLNNLSDNPFFCTATEGDTTFIYLIEGLKSQNTNEVSFGNNSPSPSVEISRDSVTFHSKSLKRTIFTGYYENFDCYRKHDISLAHLFNDGKHLLIAFNEKTGKAKSFKAQKVKVDNDKIYLTQKFDDLAGHNLESTFKIDNEGMKKIDCQISYNFEKPRLAYNQKVVPFAFLEAIKADNFDLAAGYLSSSMQVTPEKLKAFVPKLDFFFPVSDNKFYIFSNGEFKTITFDMTDNKIIDLDLK